MIVNEPHEELIAAWNPQWINHIEHRIEDDGAHGWSLRLQSSLDELRLPDTPPPPPMLQLADAEPDETVTPAQEVGTSPNGQFSATAQAFMQRGYALASRHVSLASCIAQLRELLRFGGGPQALAEPSSDTQASAQARTRPQFVPPIMRRSDGWVWAPPCFASSALAGSFPWEVAHRALADLPAVLSNCKMGARPAIDPFMVKTLDDGTLVARYRLDIRCKEHPDDECHIIPNTTITFTVSFPPPAPGMDGLFVEALKDALRTSFLEAVEAHLQAGSQAGA